MDKNNNIEKKGIINYLKRFLTIRLLLGIIIGGIGGYLYYHFVGCASGTCSISSDPVNMTAYGMLIGGVLLLKEKKETKTE